VKLKIDKLEKEIEEMNLSENQKKLKEEEINRLRTSPQANDQGSTLDSIGHIMKTFFNFAVIYFKKLTVPLFSIIVHYIGLLIDILEITLTSFLEVVTGVTELKTSAGTLFTSMVSGIGNVLSNPALLASVGVATGGTAVIVSKGLQLTTGAASKAMEASNQANKYSEQAKANGFSNMANFVATNPQGVWFFTSTFLKYLLTYGVAGPLTLVHAMTKKICEFIGLADDDGDDDDVDIDTFGKNASMKMMLESNEIVGKWTANFSKNNESDMKSTWKKMSDNISMLGKSLKDMATKQNLSSLKIPSAYKGVKETDKTKKVSKKKNSSSPPSPIKRSTRSRRKV
jgi:hypothetical protein